MQVTPKTFRKAFATWQAERGTHPRILQAIMGHAPGSRMTDQHYVFANEELQKQTMLSLSFCWENEEGNALDQNVGKIWQRP